MTTKHLLFVDDRKDQHVIFKDSIDEWNNNNAAIGRDFTFETKADYPTAVEALKRTRFDGALIDLRLPSLEDGVPEQPLGNDLAKQGLRDYGMPVAIITALETDLDPEISNSETVRVFNKGDEHTFRDAISWFADKWLMMEVLAESRTRIRKISADVFADRLWPRWGSYVEAAGMESSQLTPIVTRQNVWHMGEVLGIDGKNLDEWHPFENYIWPPLQPDRAHTGDIFDFDGIFWIILSPPCDMANKGKISDALLAKCDLDVLAEWDKKIEALQNAEDSQQAEKHAKWFRKLVNQSEPAQHFLPPLPGSDDKRPVMVQFSKLQTIEMNDLTKRLGDRIASVSAPFLTNLTQRFGAYISRVGQPNIAARNFLP